MREVIAVVTFDGLRHENAKAATRHLDKLYGDEICSLGRSLTGMNYTKTTEFIDANLARFEYLKRIKDDMELEPLEGE